MHSNHEPSFAADHRWPEGAVVYQVYPRSFQDANADGVGDLPGVISRLDYIKDLGVTALWLSPFYPSPMADFGYDVADYCDVDPLFGTLDDFKQLLHEAHARGLRVIVDLVPNHTSDQHAWFKQSRQSRDGPYADWYIWNDGKLVPDGSRQTPNNWLNAIIGQTAWEWDELRQQYYLHSFAVQQPDLNWANTEVREAIKNVMRFWLDHGVDGFRVDAVYWLGKEPLLLDDTPNADYVAGDDLPYNAVLHDNSQGWPTVYAHLSELASVLKEPPYAERQPFMVTEAYPERHNPVAAYMSFYESIDPEVAAPFNFEGLTLPWEAASWHRFLKSFHQSLNHIGGHAVPSYAFGNHDNPRLMTRLGPDRARAAAVMLLTLPGMAFVYYGDEIGMHDGAITPDQVQDPAAAGSPHGGAGRDPARTPMQWTAAKQTGFSDVEHTWLPIADDYAQVNVNTESADPASVLSLYRRLCGLRQDAAALRQGHMVVLDLDHTTVIGYERRGDNETYLVLINFSAEPTTVTVPGAAAKFMLSSDPRTGLAALANGALSLRAYEAAVFVQETRSA